ncbi:MAG TPA: DUF3750 domain-containing protein [Gammaproteobacteria bacterium]|nr:DUF3750 domain-containing protein [Gammaproteobacteria bacterium]
MRRPSAKWLWLIPPFLFGMAYLDRVEGFVDGRDARRAPIGLAPNPRTTPEPVVQVYAARAVRWRGYFGVHTWVAVKPRDADEFTIYEVNGWRLRRTGTAVSVDHRPPDARWFGNRPELLADVRGDGVDDVITRIEAAVASYPYADTYRVWPGPNSNTFVAHLLRAAPELRADLPANAIGKDYLERKFVARSPSGTGAQVNLFGVVGALAGIEEGLELSVLGLTFGVDPLDLSLKVPMAGRLGWPRPRAPGVAAAEEN